MSNAGPQRTCMVQGRIVWTSGNLFAGKQKVDQTTKQARVNAQGLPMMEYGFGLAVPKSVLGQSGPGQPGEIWAAIHAEAQTLYNGGAIPPSFAMKYKDGDSIDDQGKPFAQREGYAGCLVFACTTSIPIKYFKFENGQNFQIADGIKCGDYVNVQLSIKAHAAHGQGKAGLYLNPNAVQFLGFGKEIVNTPSGDQIFGNGMPAIPQGASATPVAPIGMIQPPQQAQPFAPPMQQYQQPPAQPQYQQAPQAPPQPHFGVVPPQFQPPAGGQPQYQQQQAPPPMQQYQQPPAQPQYQQAPAQQYPPQPMGMPPLPR